MPCGLQPGRLHPCAAAIFAFALAGFAASGMMWLSCTALLIAGFAVMVQVRSVEHSDPVDGSGPASWPGDERLFDDVHRYRTVRRDGCVSLLRRLVRGPLLWQGRVYLLASGVFASRLSSIRPTARRLIRERQAADEINIAEILDPAAWTG